MRAMVSLFRKARRSANTRKGKQVMNVKAPDEAKLCQRVSGDHIAVVGENRKMLVFPLSDIPEMTRGKGRAPAKIQGWRGLRRSHLRSCRWPVMAGFGGSHPSIAARKNWSSGSAHAPLRGRLVPKGFSAFGQILMDRAFSSQKCETPMRGNQSTGLIFDPAPMRWKMRQNK